MKIKDILDWLDVEERAYRFEGDESKEVIGFSSLTNYKGGGNGYMDQKAGKHS